MLDVSDPEDLIAELDTDGIEKTVLFGYNGFGYDRKYAQDVRIEELARRYPDRIIPFICDLDFKDPRLIPYVEKKLDEDVFRGLGEILLGHKVIKEMYFSDISYSDSSVISLFHSAAEYRVPVLVHVDPPYKQDFLPALEECRNTTFIWAHIGYNFLGDFGGTEQNTDVIKDLLESYPNLYFDISHWKISPVYLLAEAWRSLIESYSDRFLIGTDMTDHYNYQSVWLPAYRRILDSMTQECRAKMSRANLLKICNCC
jgi:predicted TIM-barrel fold metal-dependent hydrolase